MRGWVWLYHCVVAQSDFCRAILFCRVEVDPPNWMSKCFATSIVFVAVIGEGGGVGVDGGD